MIKVLVVEDSAVVREFLLYILGSDPDIEVVGIARDGEEAVEAVQRLRPDVVTMDIHMPKVDGLEATRRIMETLPTPIVIVSGSSDPHDMAITFRATLAGALAMLRRPSGIGYPQFEAEARELLQTVKLMSEVKVVRRWPRLRREAATATAAENLRLHVPLKVAVVAIGASTGGPPAIQTILAGLPRNFPAAVLIVQHMASGFVGGFVDWLGQTSALPVRLASNGESILPGHVYVAPEELQMRVERGGKIALNRDEPEGGLRPAVSCLFRSLAENFGGNVVAVLLTGMGRDGAAELKRLRDGGAFTIAQDQESCVVFGMPGEAARLDAAQIFLPPEKIAPLLSNLANNGLPPQ